MNEFEGGNVRNPNTAVYVKFIKTIYFFIPVLKSFPYFNVNISKDV